MGENWKLSDYGVFGLVIHSFLKFWKYLLLNLTPSYLGQILKYWTLGNIKNYETYYRSARLRVLTSFEQFYLYWTIFFTYLSLFWSVSIYLGLIWFSSVYLDLFQFIIIHLWLSWVILGLFVQKFDFFGYLGLFLANLDYH